MKSHILEASSSERPCGCFSPLMMVVCIPPIRVIGKEGNILVLGKYLKKIA
jgi:hypothetical protein